MKPDSNFTICGAVLQLWQVELNKMIKIEKNIWYPFYLLLYWVEFLSWLKGWEYVFTDMYVTFNILSIAFFAQVEDEVDEINAKVFSALEQKLQE